MPAILKFSGGGSDCLSNAHWLSFCLMRVSLQVSSLCKLFLCGAVYLIAAAASEPETSEQGSNPNLYMWVKISILTLAHCIMRPVGFYHNAARSVALKCTRVVAVWSFFHCFSRRQSKVSRGEVLTVFG